MPESLYDQEAMEQLLFPPKLAASSNSVHSSDGSLISVFNSEAVQDPSSTTYTNLETSLDIPVGDPTFIQQLLNNTPSFSEIEFGDDLFKDIFDEASSFEPLTDLNPEMILQESSQPPLPTSLASDHLYSQSDNSSYMNDEQGLSSPSCLSDVSERSDMNRRKTKKTSKTIPDGKLARFGNKQVVKYSKEYEDRRLKNNEAVKKSRMKAKEKQKSSEGQMQQLSDENRRLSDRVELLMKELQVLRSLYKDLKPDGSKSKGSEPMNTQ